MIAAARSETRLGKALRHFSRPHAMFWAMLVVALVLLLNEFGYMNSRDHLDQVDRLEQQRVALNNLRTAVIDAETLQRGYLISGDKRQKDADDGIHAAAGNIRNLNSGNGWRPVRLADQIQNSRNAQIIDIMPDPIPVRAILSITGDGTINDAGIDLFYGFISDTQPVHDTGSKPFQQDVRLPNQPEENLLSFRCLQIE